MANIIINNSVGLGPVANPDYESSIGGDSSVKQWITPDPSFITLDGTNITQILDRSNTSTVFTIPANRYPRLEDEEIAGFDAMEFYLASTRKWIQASNFPTSSDFTILAVVKAQSNSIARYILDTGVLPAVAGTFRASLRIEGNNAISLDVSDGPRSPSFTRARAITASGTVGASEEVFVILATWDNTAKTAKISLDKGLTYATATNGSIANITSGDMRWGANVENLEAALAKLAAGIIYNVDLSKTANASKLATLSEWIYDRFGV